MRFVLMETAGLEEMVPELVDPDPDRRREIFMDVADRWTRAEEAALRALKDDAGLLTFIRASGKVRACWLPTVDVESGLRGPTVTEPAEITDDALDRMAALDVALPAFVGGALARAPQERRNAGFFGGKRSGSTSG